MRDPERTSPPRSCVVTGGAGFLGSEVIRQLLGAGCRDVRSVDRWPGVAIRDPCLRHFDADLRWDPLEQAFEGAELVLHLAACQYHSALPRSGGDLPFFEVNVEGTRRALAAAARAGARRFVLVSTNMVYGRPRGCPIEESHPLDPLGPYARSKLEAERLATAARDVLDTAIVRPGLIVGPGRLGVFSRLFERILTGRPVWLVGSGTNRYELTAVEDVAALVLATGSSSGFDVFNSSAREVVPMRQWIGDLCLLTGSRSRVIGVPGALVKAALRVLEPLGVSPLRRDQYEVADLDCYMSSAHAAERLGWRPRWSGRDAVLATFRWYLERRAERESRSTSPAAVRS